MAVRPPSYELHLKLLVIGDSGVGKSCLLLRYCDDAFNTNFISTIGIDFKIKTVNIDGKRVRLDIWDTAGQERYHTLTTAYYRDTMGILLVYDVADDRSFQNVRKWIRNISRHAPKDVNTILIGNKCDLEDYRVVDTTRGERLAKEFNVPFFETSARDDINVDEAFTQLARDVVKRLTTPTAPPEPPDPNKKKNNLVIIDDDDNQKGRWWLCWLW